MSPIVTDGDLSANVACYARHLRAANLSPKTQRTYLDGFPAFSSSYPTAACRPTWRPSAREHVEAFITDQLTRLERGARTANRLTSIRPFFAWLVEEGELRESPMARMRKPKQPEYAPPVLADRAVDRPLRACEGKGFDERRDTALVRVMMADRRPPERDRQPALDAG